MARTIPHRELRNNSSSILREVQSGATIQISNHGEVVAIMTPPAAGLSGEARRRSAVIQGRFSELASIELDHPIQDTLDALRGDR